MATFFVLPPRPALAEALPRMLDLTVAPAGLGSHLADALRAGLSRDEAFALFREELPDGVDVDEALRDGFGAEPGDEIIELRLSAAGLRSLSRRLRVLSAA